MCAFRSTKHWSTCHHTALRITLPQVLQRQLTSSQQQLAQASSKASRLQAVYTASSDSCAQLDTKLRRSEGLVSRLEERRAVLQAERNKLQQQCSSMQQQVGCAPHGHAA